MAPQVVYVLGGQSHSYAITSNEVTIGRATENDLCIQDGAISRQHARIYRDGGAWRVVDLGSKNGTHVNEVGSQGGELRHGDAILLGKFQLTFMDETSGAVSLTPQGASVQDDIAGTVFRSAVDFQALVKAAPAAPGRAAGGQASQDVARLQRLLGIVTHMSKSLLAGRPLDDTLQEVLAVVFEHLPVERGCVMLWDEATQDLVARTVRQRKDDGKGAAGITFSRTIAEKVFRDKVSVLTTDAQSDPRFAGGASIMAMGIRSAMAAPIWNGERVEGLIYVDTPLHVKAFDDFDLDLLSALGNHAAIAIEQARLQESVMAERLSRQRLERYHSPAVIERIAKAGVAGESLSVEEREVTVLFADVVGFTGRCEFLEPAQVAALLNRCFSRMSESIFRYEGTLDKFIGDCLMAVFGAPLEMKDHALRGVAAAVDMRQALAELNEEVREDERVRFRVGMHSGRVVAGDIGSVRRSDYTVLGATVNLASRLEHVAEPGQIIVSDVTNEALGGRFRTRLVTETRPKGISRDVKCFEVLDEVVPPGTEVDTGGVGTTASRGAKHHS